MRGWVETGYSPIEALHAAAKTKKLLPRLDRRRSPGRGKDVSGRGFRKGAGLAPAASALAVQGRLLVQRARRRFFFAL